MFVKLQLDTNCLLILSSTKNSPKGGVSLSSSENVEPFKKRREQRGLGRTRAGVKGLHSVSRPNCDKISVVVQEPGSRSNGSVADPDGGHRTHNRNSVRTTYTKEIGAKYGRAYGNGVVEKVPAKCSTKWGSYGGCIPAILQALESISDLNEAFKPWEETISNKERTIILKEQSSWERALEIFEWFKEKGCYELNIIHYNIMFRILGKARQWTHVQYLWNEMNINRILPINSTYGTLIDVYSKGGLKEEALSWLAKMNEQGMEPDEVTMGIVVQLYKKAGEFLKAEEFFKNWSVGETLGDKGIAGTAVSKSRRDSQGQACLSAYTYNTLIDTYGKSGQLKEASETFARMLKEGIVPNTVTFNTMIHICGNHGQLEEVASLMQKMEELRCPPDTRTYNILIFLHVKHDNINKAASYFREMKEASLEPDLVSYRTLLYAYSIRCMVGDAEDLISEMDEKGLEIDEFTQSALTRMYIEAGMIEKSWLWFRRFHLAGNMTSECYSANIDAFGEHGYISETERVFSCCREGKKLCVLVFNVMIKAYGIGKNYDKACKLFDSMEKHGIVPDKCSYNSLIQILASADLPHLAKPYLSKMQEAGLASDCIPFCAVISSFVKLGELKVAEALYGEMIKCDIQPDIIVYGVLINAFADVGSIKEARAYADAVNKAGLTENTVIYNSLIKLYTKVGYLKEAEETYELLQLSNEGPDIYASNCMLDLYSERSMVKQAEEIFESLKRKNEANEFTYAMMLCMYKRIRRFGKANQIAKEMRELKLLNDLLSYNNVLGLYAMDGRFKEAVGTFKELLNAALRPDDCTFKSLGLVLIKCGVSKQGVGKLEVAIKRDPHHGLQAWISALSSVVGLVDEDDAWQ
ncbi:pentatricopeptide repeat-containing protein At3g23020 [Tripterygium wilfordii]|uniref:pentatricopeptide repeat-containing protein At3g23020 n=1 Tax=Tripterygium wilfordii TaxID=458696 RepID=UPI0018F7F9E8|nr:pentatricopeptide repeat-containing protein At3g23020 [Tripterygium wilfordii]